MSAVSTGIDEMVDGMKVAKDGKDIYTGKREQKQEREVQTDMGLETHGEVTGCRSAFIQATQVHVHDRGWITHFDPPRSLFQKWISPSTRICRPGVHHTKKLLLTEVNNGEN